MHRRSKLARAEQRPLELGRQSIGWSLMGDPNTEEAVVLIHGFGANTNHWLQPTGAGQTGARLCHRLGRSRDWLGPPEG